MGRVGARAHVRRRLLDGQRGRGRLGGRLLRRVLGVLPLQMLLELVAAVLAEGAVRTLVLRLAPALQRHVAHQVLARVVAALAVGAAVLVALRLVLRARQRLGALAREVEPPVLALLALPGLFGVPGLLGRRGLGRLGRRLPLVLLGLFGVLRRGRHRRRVGRGHRRERRRLRAFPHRLQYGEGGGFLRLLTNIFFTARHDTLSGRNFWT